jgi:hypothetical protein
MSGGCQQFTTTQKGRIQKVAQWQLLAKLPVMCLYCLATHYTTSLL